MDTSAEGILRYLIKLLEFYLDELFEGDPSAFSDGEKHAFVECLEVIQLWEKAPAEGLDYEVETRFPL